MDMIKQLANGRYQITVGYDRWLYGPPHLERWVVAGEEGSRPTGAFRWNR